PRVPDVQPLNIKDVALVTSPFQGGPAGVALPSGLKVILLRPTVTVPLPEDVCRSPMTDAFATVIKHSATVVAKTATVNLRALMCRVPPPLFDMVCPPLAISENHSLTFHRLGVTS